MKIIIIDPGHGGSDPGAVYKNNREKDFNLILAKKVKNYLQKNYEAKILMTRETDSTVSLDARTDYANKEKADYYLAIHQNSGGGEGFESYVYKNVGAQTKTIQNKIHNKVVAVMKKYGIRDRGQKQADFHVLRETRMPAALLEVVFIDSEKDVTLLKREDFQNELVKAIAIGVAQGLSLKQKTIEKGLFVVIAGAFLEKKNAEERVAFLSTKKINSFIKIVTINNQTYFRVQAGAFKDRTNAEDQAKKIRDAGIKDAYVTEKEDGGDAIIPKPTPTPTRIPNPTPAPNLSPSGLTIKGRSLLNATEMESFVQAINPSAPHLAIFYVEIGQDYGIRADVAYAQAIHETGFFTFRGSVKPEQNNFAGIGATGKGESAVFKTPNEGVLAHIQHLYAYSSKEPLIDKYPLVDPRFQLIHRGSAPTWEGLNGKWAVPGAKYSDHILDVYKKMLKSAKVSLQKNVKNIDKRLKEI